MSDQRTVLLFVQLVEILHAKELEATLRALPGVQSVSFPKPVEAAPSIEGEVRVGYDPAVTNAVILEQELAARGFTVLQAHEENPPPGP